MNMEMSPEEKFSLIVVEAYLLGQYRVSVLSNYLKTMKDSETVFLNIQHEILLAGYLMMKEVVAMTRSAFQRFKLPHSCLPKKERGGILDTYLEWYAKLEDVVLRKEQMDTLLKVYKAKYIGEMPTLEELKEMEQADVKLKIKSCSEGLKEIQKLRSTMKRLTAEWERLQKVLGEELEEIIKKTYDMLIESFK